MSSIERQIQDVLEAVNSFASHTERNFSELRSEMVTKKYLDEKIAGLRSEMEPFAR